MLHGKHVATLVAVLSIGGWSVPAVAQPVDRAAAAPAPWLPQDPGDSLYRAARAALNDGQYQRAATQFQQLWERHPRSAYAGDAMYWAAFARYRAGGPSNLRTALSGLGRQAERYPEARTRREAELLATRIRGGLARLGDAEAAESVAVRAAPVPPAPGAPGAPPAAALAPSAPGASGRPQACPADEDAELRLAALNALLQMDSDRALPILRDVLQRRDPCSVGLRRKGVFLVSQKRGPDTEDILLASARGDPDAEVRAQAVFWLSQVPTERAVVALDSILLGAADHEVQEKAIFALSQHRGERAGEILRRYIERRDAPDDLKAKAIFWLGQHGAPQNQAFLRDIYPRLTSAELKERVLFAVSQRRGEENQRWLLDRALAADEPLELRKKALFWAGQQRAVPVSDLVRLYDTMTDRDMKDQLIFVYSQRREPEAVDKLMAIAENDPDRELRRKAIFWLSQSKDPRVAELLLRIINR